YLDDDRIALGPEIAPVLVALADLERHGADPVEERGVVERLGDRRCRAVAPRLAIHPGVGVDLELPLPRLALLLGLIEKSARPESDCAPSEAAITSSAAAVWAARMMGRARHASSSWRHGRTRDGRCTRS